MDSKTSATDSSKSSGIRFPIKPHSYKTGHWDGMMSDEILFQDADGNNFIGTCYQGFMDGSEFCCFYDRSDYDVCSVVVWAEIPDVIENKKVYSQVTTDKEHKKLMKVLYPKNNK
jgi:hypothetical protein